MPADRSLFRRASPAAALALLAVTGLPEGGLGQIPDTATRAGPDTLEYRPLPAEALDHLLAITATFFDTPDAMGLLPTGMAEAEIALARVTLAGRDSADVRAMTGNMVHVLHAIDPTLTGGGLGLGYGFRRAAAGVRTSIQLAMQVDGVNEAFTYHAPFVEQAATNALARADDAEALARQIQGSSNARSTLRLIARLRQTILAMAWGEDSDGDGRIGYAPEEMGLAQAGYHLRLVYRMEELRGADSREDPRGTRQR